MARTREQLEPFFDDEVDLQGMTFGFALLAQSANLSNQVPGAITCLDDWLDILSQRTIRTRFEPTELRIASTMPIILLNS